MVDFPFSWPEGGLLMGFHCSLFPSLFELFES